MCNSKNVQETPLDKTLFWINLVCFTVSNKPRERSSFKSHLCLQSVERWSHFPLLESQQVFAPQILYPLVSVALWFGLGQVIAQNGAVLMGLVPLCLLGQKHEAVLI